MSDTVAKSSTSLPLGKALTVLRIIVLLITAGLMIRMAWLGDDALITLRTALNVVHGWGSGFNVTEQVQGYTHPLWFLVWIALGNVTGEWILTIIAAGIVLSCLAVGIVLWRATSDAVVLLAAAALAFSNSFMDFTTSGLENPLSWVFLGCFMIVASQVMAGLSLAHSPLVGPGLLGLLASGAFLTRFDTALLIAPILALVLWKLRRDLAQIAALLVAATVPAIVWFAWSWFTYASFLPNTFLAKQNLDIAMVEVWTQGFRYIWVTFDYDPVTAIVLIAGLPVLFILGRSLHRAAAIGITVYLAYVIYVGGDAMVGRFVATPFYVTVLMLVLLASLLSDAADGQRIFAPVVVVGVIVVSLIAFSWAGRIPSSLLNPQSAQWANETRANIWDTRGKFLEFGKGLQQWLLALGQPVQEPVFSSVAEVDPLAPLRDLRQAANAWPDRSNELMREAGWPNSIAQKSPLPTDVGVTCGLLGALGVLTGPTVHWIDTCALTDRFLAQQEAHGQDFNWVVAHYVRDVPAGYVDAVRENEPTFVEDEELATELAALWRSIRP